MALILELYDESSYSWSDKTDKCIRLRHSISSRELESIEFELIGEDVSVGQKIRVKRDNNIIFEGIVYERSRKQRGGLLSVKATAYSYLILYDRQIIYRIYQTGVKAGEIIRDLGKLIDDEFPVNLNGVEDGDALLSPWKIENRSALEIMKSVARGTNYWLRMKPCLSYLNFDGNDYVVVPHSPSLDITDALSVFVWVRFDYLDYVNGTGGLLGFAGKGKPDSPDPNYGWWFAYDNRNNKKYFGYTCFGNSEGGWAGGGNNFGDAEYSYTFEVGKWYLIGFTINSTEAKLYINGTQHGPTKSISNLQLSDVSRDLTIGSLMAGQYCHLGSIGQTLIYNSVLSQSEIHNLYYDPMNPLTDDLVLWFNFNEGSGSIVYDRSGNNNHGTIYDATWGYEVYPKYANSMLLEFKPKVIA